MSGFSGAPVQTTSTQNPLYQGQASQYQNMSQEQLQELALRSKGSPQGAIVQRVLQQKRMSPAPVAQTAPTDPAAGLPQPYALGGMLEAKGGVRMPERGLSMGATAPSAGGFLHTAGPGRTDNLGINPHSDSYIIPADVTSGMGEGNSLAGAKAFQGAIKSAPYGASMPTATHTGHRMGPPHMGFGHASGGKTQTVPIKAAGGEIVVAPEEVQAIGHAHCAPGDRQCTPERDRKRGFAILDALVLHVRKQTIKDLKGLKGPVKS
jgi:hypothetical protein